MSHFDPAINFVLEHEGGFADDPVDPGGATNYGISLRFLRGVGDDDGDGWLDGDLDRDGDVDPDDIKLLTREDAVAIYKRKWWDRYGYGLIGPQAIASKLLDLSVNMGAGQAGKIAQRACLALGWSLSVDGQVGPKTRVALHALWPVRSWTYQPRKAANLPAIVAAMRTEAGAFYRELVRRRPELERFRRGWLRRAYS